MKKYIFSIITILIFSTACQELNTVDDLNTNSDSVISNGGDLSTALNEAYVRWWQGVHSNYPAIALETSADVFTMAWDDFGAFRMSNEPREAFNNSLSESVNYRRIHEVPWNGCLTAAAIANDIFRAIQDGISIDKGGAQDQSILASAHLLRGLSWGYLGLLFDRALLVDENTNLDEALTFVTYQEMIPAAIAELDMAIFYAQEANIDFVSRSFSGLVLDEAQFVAICHSYAARFLAQWPRTMEELEEVDWDAVLMHSEAGITADFAPIGDGEDWTSYHRYIFAEAGEGPFWARLDQRLVAAFDPNQPARYPQVDANGEPPLDNTEASSADQRLEANFIYRPLNAFPVERGEWHFSHYQYNRNITDPAFAGDGQQGPMPTFLQTDIELLKAEALLHLGNVPEAIEIINNGTRTNVGGLDPLPALSNIEQVQEALLYERLIELLGTAPMGGWLDRRRLAPREAIDDLTALGGLQLGTPAHLPVPAQELRVHGIAPYNIGGTEDPLGIGME
jgi:hypothetical protein